MKNTIDNFLRSKKIAVVGVSDAQRNFGKEIYKSLKEKGYEVFPLNPNIQEYDSVKSYKNFSELPGDVYCAIFAVSENTAFGILNNPDLNNINSIWLLKGATSERNIKTAGDKNLHVVHTFCPLMFFNEKGFHRFHYKILRFFRRLPKELRN